MDPEVVENLIEVARVFACMGLGLLFSYYVLLPFLCRFHSRSD